LITKIFVWIFLGVSMLIALCYTIKIEYNHRKKIRKICKSNARKMKTLGISVDEIKLCRLRIMNAHKMRLERE